MPASQRGGGGVRVASDIGVVYPRVRRLRRRRYSEKLRRQRRRGKARAERKPDL